MKSLTLALSILRGTQFPTMGRMEAHRLDQDRIEFQYSVLHSISNNSPKIRAFGIDLFDVRTNEETACVDGDLLEISVVWCDLSECGDGPSGIQHELE